MRTFLKRLFGHQSGATAIEYGLIAALIAVASIAGLSTLGSNLNSTYSGIATNVGT